MVGPGTALHESTPEMQNATLTGVEQDTAFEMARGVGREAVHQAELITRIAHILTEANRQETDPANIPSAQQTALALAFCVPDLRNESIDAIHDEKAGTVFEAKAQFFNPGLSLEVAAQVRVIESETEEDPTMTLEKITIKDSLGSATVELGGQGLYNVVDAIKKGAEFPEGVMEKMQPLFEK